MAKTIIFPVNNKGGVGKTSVLTDLSSALAQRHEIGIIDTDHQASLAGTLLGHKDMSCRDMSYYDGIEVSDVNLMPGCSFNFNNGLSSLGLDIQPSRARLAVFPVGMLYDHPQKKVKLERIVRQDMRDSSFLMVDLPPIPHPSLVLDHTIKPLVEILNGDVRLVPLIVSTPEHNVIDIGLRQYEGIEKYLRGLGISKEQIFPISVLNKVPLSRDNKGKVRGDIDSEVIRKLKALGILYTNPDSEYAGINHFNKHFEYSNRRVRSVFFPFLEGIKDGRFSLLFGEDPELHFYPHLVDLVKDNSFGVPSQRDVIKRVYMYGLRELTNYVSAQSKAKPQKNYIKRKTIFDKTELTSQVAGELKEVLSEYYEGGNVKETEHVTMPPGCSSSDIWFNIPKSLSLEQAARVLLRTQEMVAPGSDVNLERIIVKLDDDGDIRTDKEYEIRGSDGDSLVSLTYHTNDPNKIMLGFPRAEWDRHSGRFDSAKYMQQVAEVFLTNLDSGLRKK